ncbi:MAG: hypothetical protein WAU00_23770 [Caldilinea sp.]
MSNQYSRRFGYYSAMLACLITIVTFGFALVAIPISGANCADNCVEYPYLNTAAQYPRDFLWMPLAMALMVVYVTLMASIHSYASPQKSIFSQVGLSFAMMAAGILLADYYIQFSVIPMSLIHNETAGLPVLIQYNPHGVFLMLEELGYLLMSLSFLFVAPVFSNKGRLEAAVRWVFMLGGVVAFGSLIAISAIYGLARLDRFEVVVLSTNWLVLIINGILLSLLFRRQLRCG